MRGLQCPKQLWFLKNKPELKQQKPKQETAAIKSGIQIGELAKRLFPGGVDVTFDSKDFAGMLAQTQEYIEQGKKIIYEATFSVDGSFVMADILVNLDGQWHMYEVKESTKVKPHHVEDIAFQWQAIAKNIPLSKAYVVHINKHYIRADELDVKCLFTIEEVTEKVLSLQDKVSTLITEFSNIYSGPEPQQKIGSHCKSPYMCDFRKQCWPEVSSNSVFKLYRLNKNKKFEWFHQGIQTIQDAYEQKKLNTVQKIQVETIQLGMPIFNKSVIEPFLGKLVFPIYFFDFETFMEAAPRFKGQRPYMQMPFQYSLHILHENRVLEHKEFLGCELTDPRKELVLRMLEDLDEKGSIVAFNQTFEVSRIQELAEAFSEYQDELLALVPRFSDLLDPFRNLGYYHPNFNGSFSIKSVLPALFPVDSELDYKKLNIQNGGMAMDTFAKLHLIKDKRKVDQIRADLLAYCHLDTLAMVRIYEFLERLCEQ